MYLRRSVKCFLLMIGICLECNMTLKNVYAEDNITLLKEIEAAAVPGRVYEVKQNGDGDFVSIQEGIDAANDGDTLLIYPGTYYEKVDMDGKTVNLLGAFRDKCILKYAGDTYFDAPLNIAAGTIKNMTIYNYRKNRTDESQGFPEPIARVEEYPGYAVHIESDYQYGKQLEFENCTIISENNYCVGMGCRGNAVISFYNCEFKAKGEAGCVYLHDGVNQMTAGVTNISYIDCNMYNEKSPYFFTIHAMRDDNRINLTFQRVKVDTVAYDKRNVYSTINMYTGREMSRLTDKEGIHFVKSKDSENIYKSSEDGRRRVPVCIWNSSGQIGAGWCGLTNTFLTQDCYGNTLEIMNVK